MTSPTPTDRARVLFLSAQQVYPPRSGGHIRSTGLAQALRNQGLDVFVYSMTGRKEEYLARCPSAVQTWPGGVEEYINRGLASFLIQYGTYALQWPPFWIPKYLHAAASSPRGMLLPALLRERLAWCDVVLADFPYVAPIFRAHVARSRLRILNTHNIEHHFRHDRSMLREYFRKTMRRVELSAAEDCDILVACCDGDKVFFERHARVRQSLVVPNGIDVSRFRGIEVHRARIRQSLDLADDVMVFLFTASKWGPNAEAFDDLVTFVENNAETLAAQRIHILVVGSVAEPLQIPGLTATGKVDVVEPYFSAADAALNPVRSGAGTSLKMCEWITCRLPIVTTAFGARGFRIEHGTTGFVYDGEGLGPTLGEVRRLARENPERLRQMTDEAYSQNEAVIDMDACARPLVKAIVRACPSRARSRHESL